MSTLTLAVQRIAALRTAMRTHHLDLYIVPTADPHNNEYVADRWKGREWLSGFTGSAGTLIVSLEKAALWTDSRYFLQAEKELAGSGIELMRMGVEGVPSESEWMKSVVGYTLENGDELSFSHLDHNPRIGFDFMGVSYEPQMDMVYDLADFLVDIDLLEEIWENRPALPNHVVYLQPEKWTGESIVTKMERLRAFVKQQHAQYYMTNDASEIAWLLNLRGEDIAYNPVFLAYLIVGSEDVHLFITKEHLTSEVREYLQQVNTTYHPYDGVLDFINKAPQQENTFLFAFNINYGLWERITQSPIGFWTPNHGVSPITQWRAHKNDEEIEGFRQAMLLDGAALVRFRRELDEKIADGSINNETEWSISERLEAIRAENAEYRGLSFATIAGYAGNGAIVHYEATADDYAQLSNKSFLLLDSGAHYVSGTTDITRTIPLGALTEEEKQAYTLVLKGMIQLSMAHFPVGTTGLALDFAARQSMWREGYDFGHGTGHGVGSHLCVHEGPHQIRKDRRAATEVPFHVGMTVSNEPGIYVAGKFGVRLENVLVAQPAQKTAFGEFLHFETLTLCPLDVTPIVVEMLEPSESNWLNAYHTKVRAELLPLLSDEKDKEWLINATKEL